MYGFRSGPLAGLQPSCWSLPAAVVDELAPECPGGRATSQQCAHLSEDRTQISVHPQHANECARLAFRQALEATGETTNQSEVIRVETRHIENQTFAMFKGGCGQTVISKEIAV